jgi:hypothetical protein
MLLSIFFPRFFSFGGHARPVESGGVCFKMPRRKMKKNWKVIEKSMHPKTIIFQFFSILRRGILKHTPPDSTGCVIPP